MDRHHDNDHHGRSQPDLFKRCRQDQSCCGHCRPDEPCLVELGGNGGTPVRVQSLRPVPMSAACGFSADGSYACKREWNPRPWGFYRHCQRTLQPGRGSVAMFGRRFTECKTRLDKHVVSVLLLSLFDCRVLLTWFFL